jgi:DNA-binding GntR family transcriptional regulator
MYILENEGVVERRLRRGEFVKEYTRKELVDFYGAAYWLEELTLGRLMSRQKCNLTFSNAAGSIGFLK